MFKLRWKAGFALVFMTCSMLAACVQKAAKIVEDVQKTKKIKKVFLNIRGDAKLGHRLWTYLDFELEDRGIALVDSEKDADAVADIDLTKEVVTANLGLGVIRIHSQVDGKNVEENQCASLSTNEDDGELFAASAEGAAHSLRRRFPKAHTVKLDDASDWASSESFRSKFTQNIKDSGFVLVDGPKADIVLRVNLEKKKVPVDEETVAYRMSLIARGGERGPVSSSGTRTLFAKLKSSAPEVCPDRFDNLDWVAENGGALYQTAHQLAIDLSQHESGATSISIRNGK